MGNHGNYSDNGRAFRDSRREIEADLARGFSIASLAKRHGVDRNTACRIYHQEWGHGPLRQGRRRTPVDLRRKFVPGKRYRIGGETRVFLETISCCSGELYIFRAPVGWKETYIPVQLLGVRVNEL